MRLSVFSTKPYDRRFLTRVNHDEGFGHELVFYDARLEEATARLAHGSPAVSPFVNDDLGRAVLSDLVAARDPADRPALRRVQQRRPERRA